MGEYLKPLEAAILQAEQAFFESNVMEAKILVLRPEVRVQLAEELGYSWEHDLNSYAGLIVCVCDDPGFPDFKLATF
jgi:hypothetical protein